MLSVKELPALKVAILNLVATCVSEYCEVLVALVRRNRTLVKFLAYFGCRLKSK